MRILAVDYGKKRTGLAVTDPSGIIASPLTTVETKDLERYILDYLKIEQVATIVIGYPRQPNGEDSDSMRYIRPFVARLRKVVPEAVAMEYYDERYTTKIAFQSMIDGGLGRKKRDNKNGIVDMVSASLILQDYMEYKRCK
ncbi:MAG: Holliday junction resolvase RuvX [Marinilabiliaceae bacterium]|nr:Holliday junction resolvase RuvX [Marinilabiliaceae bacterium]